MHDRHRPALAVQDVDLAGIRHAGGFLDRQGVHISTQHDRRPVAIAQQPDDSSLADPGGHFVTGDA